MKTSRFPCSPIYRIATERKNIDSIKQALWSFGLGYTLVEDVGSWHGQPEESLMIELNDVPKDLAETAAHAIKRITATRTFWFKKLQCEVSSSEHIKPASPWTAGVSTAITLDSYPIQPKISRVQLSRPKMPDVQAIIKSACDRLYREQKDLIDMHAHERTIAGYLADYLRPHFRGLHVDSDPNRMGDKGQAKRALDGRLLIPDLIVHTRGSIEGPNIAVIQIKGFWNKEDRHKDEADLHDLWRAFRYQHLYRLELNRDGYELTRVAHPEQ